MKKLVVGSRESRLAMVQSLLLVDYLRANCPGLAVDLQTMKTTGDVILDKTLDKVGGKGLFVKELDAALLDHRIDLAVHCVKDMPMELQPGTRVVCWSRREDPRDALVLPEGAARMGERPVIGTSSLRRSIQIKKLFPNCEIRPVRGNVLTRLKKLDSGEFDALVLAAAGLARLGLEGRVSRYFEPDEIIPAAGQGILAVQGRSGEAFPELEGFADREAGLCAVCERAFVRELDGGCTSPVCAHATVNGDAIAVRALYWNPETGEVRTGTDSGAAAEAGQIGIRLARRLRGEVDG